MQNECRFLGIGDFQGKSSHPLVYHNKVSYLGTHLAKVAHAHVQSIVCGRALYSATICHSFESSVAKSQKSCRNAVSALCTPRILKPEIDVFLDWHMCCVSWFCHRTMAIVSVSGTGQSTFTINSNRRRQNERSISSFLARKRESTSYQWIASSGHGIVQLQRWNR